MTLKREYPNLTITYDREVNAIYIKLHKGMQVVETEEHPEYQTNVDIGRNGLVVGVEVLL